MPGKKRRYKKIACLIVSGKWRFCNKIITLAIKVSLANLIMPISIGF